LQLYFIYLFVKYTHGKLNFCWAGFGVGAEFWAASAPSRDHVGLRRKQGKLPLSQTQSHGGEGHKHVTGIRKGMKAFELPQSYNFIFACNGAGSMMPILVGFRSNKVQAGKKQIFPLKKYSSLFAGSQPCSIVIYNMADTKLLPKLFVNRILNPTLEVETAGRTQRRRVFHCL
jgi:hypothetical protein